MINYKNPTQEQVKTLIEKLKKGEVKINEIE